MNFKKIINKIWLASPKSVYDKLQKITDQTSSQSHQSTKIIKVTSGLAMGANLIMPIPIPETYKSMMDGTYEGFITEKMIGKIELEGKTVWDVGAHVGYQTFAFAKIVGAHGKVVAFEPNPNNVEWLKKNVDINPDIKDRIIVRSDALSNKIEKIKFNISKTTNDATSSGGYIASLTPPLPDSSYENFSTITIDAISIDELLSENGSAEKLPKPDLLKIDVEGAELNVLLGAKATIENLKPKLIIEIHTIPMMLYVSDFLKSAGYKLEIIDENDNNIFTKIIYAEYQN